MNVNRFLAMPFEDQKGDTFDVNMEESPVGEWVRYADIQHLLRPAVETPRSMTNEDVRTLFSPLSAEEAEGFRQSGVGYPDETSEQPTAWRRLIDSAYTLKPEWIYTNQAPKIAPEKWEPLYAGLRCMCSRCRAARLVEYANTQNLEGAQQ